MLGRLGASLENKALGLGMGLAALALGFMDVAFFTAHGRTIIGGWEEMHRGPLEDWARMCEKAMARGEAQLLPRLADMVLLGPLAVESAYLSGPDGKFIVHTDPKSLAVGAEEWRKSLPGQGLQERRRAVRLSDGSKAWAGIVYPLPHKDKIERLVFEQQRFIIPPVLAANALMLLLVAAVSIVVSRTIIRPVKALAAAAREVSLGDFSAEVPVTGSDEMAALQRDFNAMARRLGEVEKLKGDFLGKITHDLRNPLGAVMGYARLLLMELRGPLNREQKEALDTVLQSTSVLSQLIDNILDMTKIEAGAMEYAKSKADLAELIESAVALLRPQAEQYGVALKTDLQPGLPALVVDLQALRRVVLNLLSNAIKFTPKGGSVAISAATSEGAVRVEVKDTGIGIPAGKMGALFSKFTAIHDPKDLPRRLPGTGLGLAICKEIIERHGGRIGAESEAGKGAAFFFTLPAS